MDDRLLTAIRRFWTVHQVEAAYQAVLTAYASVAVKEVTIIGNTFDGQGANAAIVLDREGMVTWMDVLEARLSELEDQAAGLPDLITGSPVTNFSTRRVGT